MRAVWQAADHDGRLDRRVRPGVIPVSHDAAGLRDVQVAASEGQPVRAIEVLENRDHLRRAAGAAAGRQRQDPPPGRDRHDQHAFGIDGEGPGATDVLGEDVDAKAGGHGDLARVGHADAQQREHRADSPRRDGLYRSAEPPPRATVAMNHDQSPRAGRPRSAAICNGTLCRCGGVFMMTSASR